MKIMETFKTPIKQNLIIKKVYMVVRRRNRECFKQRQNKWTKYNHK